MADDTSGFSAVLAPWLQSNPWDPSNYGGSGNFGASILAAAGPTSYKQPFLVGLGKAMQAGQQNALQTAQARMGLGANAISIQQQMAMMPLIMARLARMSGSSSPSPMSAASQGATNPTASTAPPPYFLAADPNASPASSNASPAANAPSGASDDGSASAAPASPRAPWMDTLDDANFAGMLSLARGNPQGVIDAAKLGLEYNPSVATGMGVAKDPLTLDRAMAAQSLAVGDRQGAQAAYLKYLKDSGQVTVDRYGNVTTLGNINPKDLGVNTFLPAQGMQTSGGVASPIPGILPTRQALAGAEALGKAQGETVELSDKQGNKYVVPKTAVLSGGGAGAGSALAGPGVPGGNGLPLASPGPAQLQYLGGRGKESADYVGELQKAADAATDTNYSLDQILTDAKNATLGPAAPAREYLEKHFGTLGGLFGQEPPKELATYQQIEKYANKIAFSATRLLGSREAAQIVNLQMQSNPNKALAPEAFSDVALSMKAMNNYMIAKNQTIQAAARANGGDALGAASQWTRTIDPRVWDLPLSPDMGKKWAAAIGPAKIAAAYPYLNADEQQALLRNLPSDVLRQLK